MTSKCIILYMADSRQNISSTFLGTVFFCKCICAWVGGKAFSMPSDCPVLTVVAILGSCIFCDCFPHANARTYSRGGHWSAVDVHNSAHSCVVVKSAFSLPQDGFSEDRTPRSCPVHHSFLLSTHRSLRSRWANLEALWRVEVDRTTRSSLAAMEGEGVIMDCRTWGGFVGRLSYWMWMVVVI